MFFFKNEDREFRFLSLVKKRPNTVGRRALETYSAVIKEKLFRYSTSEQTETPIMLNLWSIIVNKVRVADPNPAFQVETYPLATIFSTYVPQV